ncbi:MAG: glutathione-dependent formaldehyde dehydrogenase [Ktedonobacterales bacterium]|nr:glutathione-dependent formaldehyde dehydrogenase [Ktedonobacterales bacterium]
MKAVCWTGIHSMKVEQVPDPKILNPHDAIVRVTSTAICGSDLHLYDGIIPTVKRGDILGHEFMGEIVEVGSAVTRRKVGERVVVPATIACGNCWFCEQQLWSLCDNTNPNADIAEALMGYTGSAIYGYTHAFGGYAGGQAEYVRVPFADVGPMPVPDHLTDEQVLFLTDIFPTGYMAAENCHIQPGDTVAVWGCGPVGQFAIQSAHLLGAERVIAIDRVAERLEMARTKGRAEVIDYSQPGQSDVVEVLKQMTGGRGPDACIEAVGSEAHAYGLMGAYDKAKQVTRLETDRPHALREAIQACRKGGVVSVPGEYSGFIDKMPMGAFFNKGLTMKTGQTHMHKYMRLLLPRIEAGEIDPSFVITHRLPLDEAPHAYEIFRDKRDKCIKVVLQPS